jgi:GNAT superfamily N-acetyltransferase
MEAMLESESRSQKMEVHRARPHEIEAAWKFLSEYYLAANVVARDSKDDVAASYFEEGAGVWLACASKDILGCIAVRRIASMESAGEVKRLYVQPAFRGQGIAAALYRSLETYAAGSGHEFLYLDIIDEMVATQRFYQALEFERCQRCNDNPQATIFMRKKLCQSNH